MEARRWEACSEVERATVGEGTSVCGAQLELSTGVVVGFCYHKAADLRVRQAAHSLPCDSCIQSCSAIAVSVNVSNCLHWNDKHLTGPLRVWSLTGGPRGVRCRVKV